MVNSYASDELYHWGVKGMKWGIRRYQNKDGSLTAAGQKRYNKEMQKAQNEQRILANKKRTQEKMDRLESIRKKNAEDREALSGKSKGSGESSGKKSVSEMTDAELSAHNQRLRMEKETLELQSRINQLTPQKVSRGQQFIDKYGANIVKTLWNDIAKNNINKAISDRLGVPESELDKLKKEAETWKAKASIAKDKKNYRDDTEKYQKAEERRERERKEAEERREREQKAAEDNGKNESGNNQQKTKANSQSSSNSRSVGNTSKVEKDSNSNSNSNTNTTSKSTTDKTTNSSSKPKASGSSDQYISYYSNYGEKWYRKKSRSARTTTIDMKTAIDNGEVWIMDNVYDRD